MHLSQSGSARPQKFRLSAAGTLVALACCIAGSAATAQAPKTLKLGYILSTQSQLGAGAAAFAEEIAKRTGGRHQIEQYPNAALGGEVEMLKAVQLGTVDLAFITGAPLPNFISDIGVFNIPFLFRDLSHAHAVLDGSIGRSYLTRFRDKALVALAWGENGMRHLTNSKREIRTPEDLKGLKLRLPQSDVMLEGFRALGADASPLPFPLVYGALQSGEFDGQENPIATIQSAKFNQVQKYLSLTSHVYDPAILFMAVDSFDALSAADKDSFIEAAKLSGEASRRFAAAAERDGVAELARSGMKVVADIDREKFAAAMASANPKFAQRFGGDLIAQIRDYH
ncbi:MAG TPA: DctP family TRAP transporter solute-binding subunit [Xanthobacteraceae bacterium]|nr:DctP family TRAP transporter solute-binding subunit [Xanthobacteraceae bacterium]